MDTKQYFETIKSFKFLAQKELGQNFLVDSSICETIVNSLGISNEDKVLEIGCGYGSLSYFILKQASDCLLIDIDQRPIEFVISNSAFTKDQKVTNSNIFTQNMSSFTKIIGNLPYYITTGIIEKVLLEANSLKKMVIMVQKDAFSRIIARPGQKEYGPLAILVEYMGVVDRILNVSRQSFVPQPHVDSIVFSMEIKQNNDYKSKLFIVAKAMFMYRRKTIFNNLKKFINESVAASAILLSSGIDPKKRPEELSLSDFVALTKHLHEYL
ncbi:MAG: 16S rRNA (adenine(1518)-N(6)/adenine(1519)-N(6))-dimethyltransferase RsmA [Bacilli bacterium]|jgi:16S rRNA (adenine1518-N6/adenine1519-N6)-dimethyltransferase